MRASFAGITAIGLLATACGNPVAPERAVPSPETVIAKEDGLLELPPLPGETESTPTGVNSSGRVVGTSGDRPVVWDEGVPAALDLPSGASARMHPVLINDTGSIAGSATLDGALRAVRWEDGRMIEVGSLPGHPESVATGLSEAGHISGISYAKARNEPRWTSGNRGFVWHDGRMTSLPPLPEHDVSLAFDVNSDGIVLGVSVNSLDEAPRFVLWQDGEIAWAQESGDPHAWYFMWVGITDSGDAFVRTDTQDELWRWRDGGFRPYPYDEYDPPRWATAVSPSGLLLGELAGKDGIWRSDEFHAFDSARATHCSAISDGEHVVCEGPEHEHPFLARVSDLTISVQASGPPP